MLRIELNHVKCVQTDLKSSLIWGPVLPCQAAPPRHSRPAPVPLGAPRAACYVASTPPLWIRADQAGVGGGVQGVELKQIQNKNAGTNL